MEAKLYTIKLHGFLAEKYSSEAMQIYGKTVQDLVANLVARFGEQFKTDILEGAWHITLGKCLNDKVSPLDKFLSEDLVNFPLEEDELHIFPAVIGAGGKAGIGQIILGVVLIVVAIVAPYIGGAIGAALVGAQTSLAIAGVLSIAGGVMAMLTKTPSMHDYASVAGADPRHSFMFNGVVNNTEQGVPVPLVYGLHLTGSTVVSAGLEVYQI